jgi:hypothetical protein
VITTPNRNPPPNRRPEPPTTRKKPRCSSPPSSAAPSATASSQARPPQDGQEPGHVHRRDRQRAHDAALLPGPRADAEGENVFTGLVAPGCGSPSCSPTSPRPWPRAGARPRPTRCARPGPRPPARCACPTARIEDGRDHPRRRRGRRGHRLGRRVAITGESAPVIRESGGDRSAVTGGTRVLSTDRRAHHPGARRDFLDRMIALVEGAERQKTPNEIALNILLSG